MVSAEDEVVPFSNTIYPVDAKGMVEKWLLQVQNKVHNLQILLLCTNPLTISQNVFILGGEANDKVIEGFS